MSSRSRAIRIAAAARAPSSTSPVMARQKPSVAAWLPLSHAGLDRRLERLARGLDAVAEAAVEHAAAREPASSRGAHADRPIRGLDQLERALERGDARLRLVEAALGAAICGAAWPPGAGPRRSESSRRRPGERELAAGMAEGSSRFARAREQRYAVDAGARLRRAPGPTARARARAAPAPRRRRRRPRRPLPRAPTTRARRRRRRRRSGARPRRSTQPSARASMARASARWRAVRSPGSRSSSTTSRRSACRKRWVRPPRRGCGRRSTRAESRSVRSSRPLASASSPWSSRWPTDTSRRSSCAGPRTAARPAAQSLAQGAGAAPARRRRPRAAPR